MRRESEVFEQDLSAYLEVAKRFGYSEEAGEQAMVLNLSGYDLRDLGKMLASFGLGHRSALIQAMFDAEVDAEGIVAALKGLPEYRTPFPSLPTEVP